MSKRLIASVAVLFFAFGVSAQALCSSIDVGGGKKVEIVDGTISDATAKDALKYLENTYSRGVSVTSGVSRILKYYRGKYEADLQFLKSKSLFLDAMQSEKQIGWRLEESFQSFLKLYDGYRSHSIVRSGSLANTLSKAIDIILTNEKFGMADYSLLVGLREVMMFGALYREVKGSPYSHLSQYLSKTYKKTMKYELRSARVGLLPGGNNGKDALIYVMTTALSDAMYAEASFLNLRSETPTEIPYIKNVNYFIPLSLLMYIDGNLATFGTRLREQLEDNEGKRVDVAFSPDNTMEYVVTGAWNVGWSYKFSNRRSGGPVVQNQKHYTIASVSLPPFELVFPPLEKLVKRRYGSLYDWVGLGGGSKGGASGSASGSLL